MAGGTVFRPTTEVDGLYTVPCLPVTLRSRLVRAGGKNRVITDPVVLGL